MAKVDDAGKSSLAHTPEQWTLGKLMPDIWNPGTARHELDIPILP
jgi:hypothetical protein